MAETIRFEIDQPEELALKFSNGFEVEGRYGPQVMFTTTDERKMYVPPIVAERIAELRLQPGERFQIVKLAKNEGRKKGVEWQVRRVDPPTAASAPARAPISAAAPAAPVPVRPSGNTSVQQNGANNYPHANGAAAQVQQTSVQQTSVPNTLAEFIQYNTTVLTGFLCASIDALGNAEKYAASKGTKLEFNEEDVRTMANTLYIQATKSTIWRAA